MQSTTDAPTCDTNATRDDESCPLLMHEQPALEAQLPSEETMQTPLPKTQLAVLCSLRILDPLAFTQIFPYVNSFMEDLHLTNDPSQIGFYSGLVESAFAISQLFAIYPWAWMSDVVGRRPVILIGAIGLAATTVLFGLSSTFTGVIISRSLAGLFSGNSVVIPSVLCEITDTSNQAVAFPIFGLFWPIGAIIGPLIGGNFSNPAKRYPKLFRHEFWRMYPYFLPCFIATMVTVFGVVLSYFFLEESLGAKTHLGPSMAEIDTVSTYGATDDGSKAIVAHRTPSVKTLLSIPIIRALCASGFALSFVSTAFEVVFVLFCYTPIQAGGLAFSVSQIGYALAISGTLAASLQLFFMPTLIRRFDHAKMYHFCAGIWPFTFVTLPLLNTIARGGLDETTGKIDSWAISMLWIGIGFVLSMARVAYLAYSINMLLVKRHAPKSSLASTNGLVQFFICFSRAFSPAFVSSAFAISTENNILGGYLWVAIMVLICIGGSFLSKRIVEESER